MLYPRNLYLPLKLVVHLSVKKEYTIKLSTLTKTDKRNKMINTHFYDWILYKNLKTII